MSITAGGRQRGGTAKRIGLGMVFLWFFLGGIAHFVLTPLEMAIVPPYIPDPRLAVLVSGAFELLGAAGILYRRTRSAAGWGLCALTIAVTPANVYMLEHPERFDVPYTLLVARLPLQVVLLALIWWSTRPSPRASSLRSSTLGASNRHLP
jgi:uncharacterized membrane protein